VIAVGLCNEHQHIEQLAIMLQCQQQQHGNHGNLNAPHNVNEMETI
jgi:hypothetical protein